MKKLLTALLILATIPATGHAGLNWVAFTVTRHTDTTFASATMDAALSTVNDRLKLDNHDCTDDTPCSARFFRSGGVGVFGTTGDGLDVITTQAELNSVFAVTTHRCKVVTAVDFCAGGFNPSIIGCGICNGVGYIVENWVGGAVYVHEFGHNAMGCGHRNDCANNIMNAVSIGTNNSLNETECIGFGGHAYVELCGSTYDGNGGPLTSAGGPYWVTCDLIVPAGETLTIQPGAEIQFDPDLRISATGATTADGSTGTITIYSNNDARDFPTASIAGVLQIGGGGELFLR